MAVRVVSTPDLNGYTFYRNKEFDISFSVASTIAIDTCLYLSNSTPGVRPYASNGRFRSGAGINTVGSIGTLSVDVMTLTPQVVGTSTPQSYIGASGVCTDASGIVYFVVANQNRIFSIDLSGTVAPFAGDGVAGDTNGPRLSARFREPNGITTDGSGTFYVGDQYRLRKIDPSGTVSTVAGSSNRGYTDGPSTAARFWLPSACVIRPNGDVLVTESDRYTIRNVTPSGFVTTYAGRDLNPFPGPAFFADGSLNQNIITPSTFVRGAGVSTTLYDTSDTTASWRADASQGLTTVNAMYCDTTTSGTNRILYGGTYSSTYSSPLLYQTRVGGPMIAASFGTQFDSIRAIGHNPIANIWYAGGIKAGSNRPVYVSVNNAGSWSVAGGSANILKECYTIATGPGTGVWMAGGVGSNDGVLDSSANLLISTLNTSVTSRTSALWPISRVNQIVYANGTWVAVGRWTGTQSNLGYSTDNGTTWTLKFVALGNATALLSSVAYGGGRWVVGFEDTSSGPAFGYSSDLSSWSTPTSNFSASVINGVRTILYSTTQQKFIASGVSSGGYSNVFTSSDGLDWSVGTQTATDLLTLVDVSEAAITTTFGTARMYFPYGLLYDPSGTLYIADQYNNRVRSVAAGSTTMGTFAGTGADAITNGTLTTAAMARPANLARDASTGTIYVGSQERFTIQAITGSNVSLFTGAYGAAGYVDGPISNARFNGIAGLATFGNSLYAGEIYNGDVRRIVTFSEVRPGTNLPPGYTIIATSNYPITIRSRIDVSWTSVGGQLPLYKFEPFSNTLTARVGGDTLVYPASSTELLGYLSGTGTANVAFQGPNGASTAYTYPLTLAVRCLSGSIVVDDVSTSVTIDPARIITTPCNSSLVFYRNEPSPAPVFSLVSSNTSASLVYAATTLPTGLEFTRSGPRSFALTGTPTVQTISSNYTILATDTSGRTYSTKVSMVVNPERLVVDVSGSLALSNVGLAGPIDPITFTSRFAPYGNAGRAMRYTWFPQPPAGIQFRDICGTAISGSNFPVSAAYDASFTLTLSGTISEAQLRAFAVSNTSTYTMTLTGTRIAPLPTLSPSLPKTITFKFAEFVDMSSNVPPRGLYVGLPVSNYWYSATTYFPVLDTSIQSIEVTDGFIPDGLDASFTFLTQRFTFAGTPTTATTYTFTLTATNGSSNTASLPVTATVRNDSVTITALSDSCFNFIQTRNLSNGKTGFYPYPISYSVSSASGCNAILTGTTLPPGVSLVSIGTRYDLSGRPTTPSGLATATLTGSVPETGVSATKTFLYSVSAEVFNFSRDPSDISFNFIQNVPIKPVQIDVSTLSENSVIRFSSPSIPPALQVTNTGLVQGTPLNSNSGTFDVTAYTAYATGTKPYSYVMTPDQVLLQPTVYTTRTAPGQFVSIPINGYSLSALTVSNYRFQTAFPYGLSVNPTTGLLSGTLASSLPTSTTFTVVGSAGTVNGTLVGTMATANLTVNRAQMLRLESTSNLSIYSSDNNGVVWSKVGATYSNTTALTIGTNESNVYLIPLSGNTVLKSADGASYTSNSFTGTSPFMTALVNKPGTSTWWMAGSCVTGVGVRAVHLYTSADDGETWELRTIVSPLTDRGGNVDPYASSYQAYLNGGVALAYKDNVLLIGGDRILRSTDEGSNWSSVTNGFQAEVAGFSLEQQDVWVATGSDLYATRSSTYTTPTTTIKYSLDKGATWTNASAFGMFAYDVHYGNGQWFATGIDISGGGTRADVAVRYSLDAVNWAPVSSIPVVSYTPISSAKPPLALSVAFDETEWVVFRTPDDGTVTRYSHPYDTPLTSGWTATTITSTFTGPAPTTSTRLLSYVAQTVDPGADVTTITFPPPNTGPTFISPAQSTYVVWQYMPLPPIVFSAPGATAYFISTLPVGLRWDSTTRTIEGACMRLGTQTFTVYAKNSGVTAFTVTLIVNVPRIIKQQGGAGAYTSLLRDYTEVVAAINARDTRVNPVEEVALGSFASPYAPDVVTPSNCPC
jgi:hypothetical protein